MINKNNIKGTSLVESLISIALISYVVVNILGGISNQQMAMKKTGDKNAAIMAAEMRLEEISKFPANQLSIETYTDYVLYKNNGFEVYQSDQYQPKQFRRTTIITKNLTQQIATIHVRVEYGAVMEGSVLTYPFKTELSTRRTLL